MAVITRAYSETSGTIAFASSVNRVVDDLYTLQNGNINSANIGASGVGDLNIQTSAIITRTLDASAIINTKIANCAIAARHLEDAFFSSMATVTLATDDFIPISDTSDSGKPKKVTVSNVRDLSVTTLNSANAAYTVSSTDQLLAVTTSGGACTITLPAASSNTGRVLRVKKTSDDFTAITVDGNGADTIDDTATTTLNTRYEALSIVSNGTQWLTLERRIHSEWVSYTPTITGWGTATLATFWWRRSGDSLYIRGSFLGGNVEAAVGTISLPSGLSIDTNKIPGERLANLGVFVGNATSTDTNFPATGRGPQVLTYYSVAGATVLTFSWSIDSDAGVFNTGNVGSVHSSGTKHTVSTHAIPIATWKG